MLTTYIWKTDPNGKRSRMNVIHSGSKFKNFKTPSADAMLRPEVQGELAQKVIQGWKVNGPFPANTKWEITQDNGEQLREEVVR